MWSNKALSTAAVVFLAAASSGCAAAGMAAVGPVMSAIEALADRTVERTLPGDLSGAYSATLETISRLGLEIRDMQRADEAWTFEAANEKVTVHGQFTRLSPSLTRLSLRVEIGTLAADKSTADEILNQISVRLADQLRVKPSPASENVGSSRLAEIEAELQRLRAELEAARARAERRVDRGEVDAGEAAGTRRAPGVISIPASYGVPTIAAPPGLDVPQSDRGGASPLAPVNSLMPAQSATSTERLGK
jgi:hypothetical protein